MSSDSDGCDMICPQKIALDRLRICLSCTHCVDPCCGGGCCEPKQKICELVELKHPGKAVVANGVKRLELSCPLGKWEAIHAKCVKCRRKTTIKETGSVCVFCENKRKLNGNRNR